MPAHLFQELVPELCISLVRAKSEDEIIKTLRKVGYWDDLSKWRHFADNENNYSVIGNQQAAAETALVEKITNAIDAVLTNACLERGIDPSTPEAPQSIEEAQRKFFRIPGGQIANLGAEERTQLARHIHLALEGRKGRTPNVAIIDDGEGQTPSNFPHTFCSLNKSNKLRIQFVHGKFNMGGTGVLPYAGEHNMQLIVSKRNPLFASTEQDERALEWGFTLVRKRRPTGSERSAVYEYLAPAGEVLSFACGSLPLLPDVKSHGFAGELKWGTFIKLYDYKLRLRSNALFDLNYKLNELLPSPALPIRIVELREGYSGHSLETTMSGLVVRLIDKSSEIMEEGFPSTGTISLRSQEMSYRVYALRAGKQENYLDRAGVGFSLNGQVHASIPKAFFLRDKVGLDYLKDSLYVLLECSLLSSEAVGELFMNSRDRMRDGKLQRGIERELEIALSRHDGLKRLNALRREEQIRNKVQESAPLQNALELIIRRSPSLAALFVSGQRISNPLGVSAGKRASTFVGKLHPTFFTLAGRHSLQEPKQCEYLSRIRLEFLTDVVNDYFDRPEAKGVLTLFVKSIPNVELNISKTLWNGRCNVQVSMPRELKLGQSFQIVTSVSDDLMIQPIVNELHCLVVAPTTKSSGTVGSRPPSTEGHGDQQTKDKLTIPPIHEVYKEDWSLHEFDELSALDVKRSPLGGFEFFCNMDNKYYQAETRNTKHEDLVLLKTRYTNALALIGLAVLQESTTKSNSLLGRFESSQQAANLFTRAICPVLLPMIQELGVKLDIRDLGPEE